MATSESQLPKGGLIIDDPDVPKTRKAFVPLGLLLFCNPARQQMLTLPLENNPEVMTSLIHKLGFSSALSFHDVFSIEDPELLAFVPRPATALLLVFPVSKSYELFRAAEDKDVQEYKGKGAEEPVIWYKQTIRNACGLIGILHAVSNGASKEFISMTSIPVEL